MDSNSIAYQYIVYVCVSFGGKLWILRGIVWWNGWFCDGQKGSSCIKIYNFPDSPSKGTDN